MGFRRSGGLGRMVRWSILKTSSVPKVGSFLEAGWEGRHKDETRVSRTPETRIRNRRFHRILSSLRRSNDVADVIRQEEDAAPN